MYNGENFKARQSEHFSRIIWEKWECAQPCHGVCVPTDDGQHWQLSERHVHAWINQLIKGKGTTAEPPPGTFEDIGGGAVWNRRNGRLTVTPVHIPPNRRRNSIGSRGPDSPRSGPPGRLVDRAFRWFRQRRLDVVEELAAVNRANLHISCLRSWQNEEFSEIGPLERRKTSEMLEDALNMSKQCSSKRINEMAYDIAKEAHNWLNMNPNIPHTPDNVSLLLRVKVCMIPLILVRVSDDDSFAGDLAWDLLEALTHRGPLLLIDDSPDPEDYEDRTARAIRIVSRHLAYSKCAMQHSWIAVHLLRIVEMTLKIRPLSELELTAIWEFALGREEQITADVRTDTRSWEVALFAHCSTQAPKFKEVVLRPTGFPLLITTMETKLGRSVHNERVPWEDVTVTLRSLAFLTEHDWVVDSNVVNERALVAIMNVFRRDIPERHFPLHYWALHTLKNVLAHRPKFVPVLVDEGILAVLSRVIPSISSPTQGHFLSSPTSAQQFPPSPRSAPLSTGFPSPLSGPLSTGFPSPLSLTFPPGPPSPLSVTSPPFPPSPLSVTSPSGPPSPLSITSPPGPHSPLSITLPSGLPSPLSITSSPSHPSPRFEQLSPSLPSPVSIPLSPGSYSPCLAPLSHAHRRSNTQDSYDSQYSPSDHHRTSPSSPIRPPPDLMTPAQIKRLQMYKEEAAKRAEELSVYINRYTDI
ncbi:hypothetical protein BU17DRAFT_83086 [Hysterangium stoloniferum]|nr:hypothetical protein BU17DRAFT_83086 [Hysterangium stoloniferum]